MNLKEMIGERHMCNYEARAQLIQNPERVKAMTRCVAPVPLPSASLPHRLVAGLTAVVAGGQVAHRGDREAAALAGVRVLPVAVVPQALEKAADDLLVVADVVGVLGDVVAVPGGARRRQLSETPRYFAYRYPWFYVFI